MPRLDHDGVALAYEEAGTGSPPLLFVHGWACDRTDFTPQVAHFGRTHRTLAVDLRGHGESDKPRQDYTMAGFADDVAWLCGQLRVERPVVVGHSMGGLVALHLAARHAAVPAAIVMLDMPTPGIVGPLPAADPRWLTAAALRGAAYRVAVEELVEGMFLPTDDRERRARIAERMAAVPQHVLASAFEQCWTCDLAAAAAACQAPLLYIEAVRPRPELARFGQLCPQLTVGRTVGAGHFHHLEVPDQVNAMIARFLAISAIPASTAETVTRETPG
jgi:pimeloyl-ACP methyl ester carboxylesterase